jgi:hypothetical protein
MRRVRITALKQSRSGEWNSIYLVHAQQETHTVPFPTHDFLNRQNGFVTIGGGNRKRQPVCDPADLVLQRGRGAL